MKRMLLPAFLFVLTTALTVSSQTPAQTDAAALEQGKLVEREISPGEMHPYNLTIPAGGYVHIKVDQIGLSVSLSAFVDGKKTRGVDSTSGGDSELLSLVAEAA